MTTTCIPPAFDSDNDGDQRDTTRWFVELTTAADGFPVMSTLCPTRRQARRVQRDWQRTYAPLYTVAAPEEVVLRPVEPPASTGEWLRQWSEAS